MKENLFLPVYHCIFPSCARPVLVSHPVDSFAYDQLDNLLLVTVVDNRHDPKKWKVTAGLLFKSNLSGTSADTLAEVSQFTDNQPDISCLITSDSGYLITELNTVGSGPLPVDETMRIMTEQYLRLMPLAYGQVSQC